jgi:ParB family transcriptional regulator, chromosome partitioning protein
MARSNRKCPPTALLDLPDELQDQVESGAVPARTAYELSKVADDARRQELARQAAAGSLTTAQAARVVQRKKLRKTATHPATKQTFYAENGWIVTVSSQTPGTYHHLEQALTQALDEVRLRIANNVRL